MVTVSFLTSDEIPINLFSSVERRFGRVYGKRKLILETSLKLLTDGLNGLDVNTQFAKYIAQIKASLEEERANPGNYFDKSNFGANSQKVFEEPMISFERTMSERLTNLKQGNSGVNPFLKYDTMSYVQLQEAISKLTELDNPNVRREYEYVCNRMAKLIEQSIHIS